MFNSFQLTEVFTSPVGEVKASELIPMGGKSWGSQHRIIYRCPCGIEGHYGVRVVNADRTASPFIYCPVLLKKWLITGDTDETLNADVCISHVARFGLHFGIPLDYRPVG